MLRYLGNYSPGSGWWGEVWSVSCLLWKEEMLSQLCQGPLLLDPWWGIQLSMILVTFGRGEVAGEQKRWKVMKIGEGNFGPFPEQLGSQNNTQGHSSLGSCP